jgi:hypothetical protein
VRDAPPRGAVGAAPQEFLIGRDEAPERRQRPVHAVDRLGARWRGARVRFGVAIGLVRGLHDAGPQRQPPRAHRARQAAQRIGGFLDQGFGLDQGGGRVGGARAHPQTNALV